MLILKTENRATGSFATLQMTYDRSSVVGGAHFRQPSRFFWFRSGDHFGACQTRGRLLTPSTTGHYSPLPATPRIFPLNPKSPGLMVWRVDYYGSYVCDPCDRSFNDHSALMQHLNRSSSHNYCDTCDRDFTTYSGLVQHYANSPQHDYCQSCDEHFDDSDDLDSHMDDCHWWCRDCNKTFVGEVGLQEHFRQSHANRYCEICKKLFGNASSLRSVCVGFRYDTPVS